ncbi:hypothetical protein HBH70_222240 [Parastagonospora nodorum]|nr:hypothetical protein HBH53_225900 [Parastagonospora nodorum]KAH3956243.1 hypothetical protein HBH51_246190 [Parastagonospora nodorum]KAH4045135.1 hypothetical protein HBH49_205390 [Parastagonospora nodorum]KAH4111726.1 hypothetical protein HBH47_236180 [Parastagonospora nodorum]KAH4153353.1 hypothetical protein HBH43_224890 [Parastagonospora nodorum]
MRTKKGGQMEDTRKKPGPSLPADAFLHFLLWERQVALAAFTRTSSSKGTITTSLRRLASCTTKSLLSTPTRPIRQQAARRICPSPLALEPQRSNTLEKTLSHLTPPRAESRRHVTKINEPRSTYIKQDKRARTEYRNRAGEKQFKSDLYTTGSVFGRIINCRSVGTPFR